MNRYEANVPLAEYQQPRQGSLGLHPMSEPWFSCYYKGSFWLWEFLCGDYTLEVFIPSYICVWNYIPTNKRVTLKYLPQGNTLAQTPSMIKWVIRISDVLDRFLGKTNLILSKNFLNFWFDAIKKKSIIKLCRYRSKGYTSVVLGDFDVIFLEERREDEAFYPSLYCVLVIQGVTLYRSSKIYIYIYIYIYICVCVCVCVCVFYSFLAIFYYVHS